MKNIFFTAILLFSSFYSFCQDIIIKKSGEEIKAKVMEIGIDEIKYKRFDFQDGPLYSISKTEVVLVRYENGINEVINSGTTKPPVTTTPTVPVPSPTPVVEEKVSQKIEYSSGSYNQGGRYISKVRVLSTLRNTKDPQINRLLRHSSALKTTGNVVALSLGLPLLIVGSITTIHGALVVSDGYDPDGKGIVTAGAIMTGTGLLLQFVNIGFQSSSKRKIDAAIEVYNEKYADKPEVK